MWRSLIVLAGASIILAAAFWAELNYQPRVNRGHQQQQHSSDKIGNPSQESVLSEKFVAWVDGIVGWTDTHHDFVLAVANVFLAAFTLALFAATFGLLRFAKRQAGDMQSLLRAARDNTTAAASQAEAMKQLHAVSEAQERVMQRHADAALAQVRIMIAREAPILRLTSWKLKTLESETDPAGLVPNVDYYPVVTVRNIGRSHLEIREFCIETVFGEFATFFDANPKYTGVHQSGAVIGPTGDDSPLGVVKLVRFTENEVKAIRNRERLFWVYGFIRYFNQFTNDVWDAGFSATITADNSWVRIDLPNYAYHRRYEPSSKNPAPDS
jgi:hypothetical protein